MIIYIGVINLNLAPWSMIWTLRTGLRNSTHDFTNGISSTLWKMHANIVNWRWSSNILTTWCEEPTHWKDPDAGKDWEQEATENQMIGWHHWLNGHESEQTPGDGEGQGSVACCSSQGHKESDTTYGLNSNNKGSIIGDFLWRKPRYNVVALSSVTHR